MPYTSAFLEVIPAIDLLQGRAVRLYQGDYAQAEQVADDPIQQAEAWAAQGAPRLHVVDLDGAKSGDPVNLPIIERIVRSAKTGPGCSPSMVATMPVWAMPVW